MSDAEAAFMQDMSAELKRARSKFPGDRIMTLALAEEFGELAKAVLDEPANRVWKEAVQTAVMAARVVLDGDGSVSEWRAAKGLDPLPGTPPERNSQTDPSGVPKPKSDLRQVVDRLAEYRVPELPK